MSKISNRIGEIRAQVGLSQEDLADRMGIHRVTVANIERGKQRLTQEWMLRFSEALNVSPEHLITLPPAGEVVHVVGAVQAGSWQEHSTWAEPEQYTIYMPALPEWRSYPKQASEVRGTSMNELYPPGSVVVWVSIFDHKENPIPGKRYVIERQKHGEYEVTLKEYQIGPDGNGWLIPRTTDPSQKTPIPIIGSEDETLRIVGRVIWVARREES